MNALVMYGGLVAIFAGVFVCMSMIGGIEKETEGVGRSLSVLEALTSAPEQMRAELEAPFSDRVLAPLLNRFRGVTARLTPSDATERIRLKLDLAGNPGGLTVERVNGLKVVCFVAGLILSLILMVVFGLNLVVGMVFVMGLSVAGYLAPNMYLSNATSHRADDMRRALPDAIDLLTISVESGLGFDAALSQVARNTHGPLSDEFSRMMQEMQIGRSRAEALRSLAERASLPDLRQFVSAMIQADAFGIPMGQVLRVQSSEIRVKRRQWAEEAAQKVPVKILVPLIFCILPCLFIAVLGPAGISIMGQFTKGGIS